MTDKEELIKAAKTIKDYCDTHDHLCDTECVMAYCCGFMKECETISDLMDLIESEVLFG